MWSSQKSNGATTRHNIMIGTMNLQREKSVRRRTKLKRVVVASGDNVLLSGLDGGGTPQL